MPAANVVMRDAMDTITRVSIYPEKSEDDSLESDVAVAGLSGGRPLAWIVLDS